jgi:hypothetical protein
MDFQIPSQASLQGIVKNPSLILLRNCYANGPSSPWNFWENVVLRLVPKRGDVVKKHTQARLRVFFQQQIQHSHSESTQ